MAKREGRWDCQKCGSKGNLGRYKACPTCGASRGHAKFYLPEGEPEIDDSLSDLASAGPDWVCHYCDTSNRGDHNFCTSCGAGKDGSPPVETKTYDLDEIPRSADEVPDAKERPAGISDTTLSELLTTPTRSDLPGQGAERKRKRQPAYQPMPVARSSPRLSLSNVLLGLVLLAGAALVVSLILGAFAINQVTVALHGFSWNRTIYVDEYRTVREEDWSIPAGGRLVSSRDKIHHYRKVFDHTEFRQEQYQCGSEEYTCGSRDLGNGFFEDVMCSRPTYCERQVSEDVYRDEPVYETWYTYDIDRWIQSRNVFMSGSSRNDPGPHWGELVLSCANQVALGCERENRRDQSYSVLFVDENGETYPLSETYDDWMMYDSSQTYILEINSFGIQNDPLRPEEE